MKFLRLRWLLVLSLFFANIFVWSAVGWGRERLLQVSFLDVGQGDAILVESPSGRTVLIDGGPGRGVLSRLAKELPLLARNIDLLIETHPDTDHVAGLPDVLERYAVRGILRPCIFSENPYDKALNELAVNRGVPVVCAASGEVVDLGGGAEMEILYAGTDPKQPPGKTNDASVVARLSYGETVFLLVGDTTNTVERYLVYNRSDKLPATVYKVSHHGSRESNDEDFLKLVKPQISIISVGANNHYGHPHKEVLESLASVKSAILRTDQEGTIVLESDGTRIVRK